VNLKRLLIVAAVVWPFLFLVLVDRFASSARHARQASRELLASPARVRGDWTLQQLVEQAEQITYATTPRSIIHSSNDAALFTPATAEDHLALPFLEIEPDTAARGVQVVVVPSGSARVNCTLYVQDQTFDVLATMPCGRGPNERRQMVPLPPQVTAVRLYFQSSDLSPVVLPRTIRISEHRVHQETRDLRRDGPTQR
jgi:hypothetical protein